jgi:3-dehydroquinate synthase
LITQKELAEIEEFIFSVYGIATIQAEDVEEIIALTAQDKKNKGKEVRFSYWKVSENAVLILPSMPKK